MISHRLGRALEPAAQDERRAQLAAHQGRHVLAAAGRLEAQLAQGRGDALAAQDGQPGQGLQVGGDGLGDAGPQPLVLAVAGDVVEAQHGHAGGRRRGPRGRAGAHRRQLLQHLPHSGRARLAVLGEHAPRQRLERRAARVVRARLERGRVAGQHGLQHLHGVLARKGRPPGQQLVDQRAQGEDVGAGVHLLAAGLLRGHVGQCPGQRAARRARPGPAGPGGGQVVEGRAARGQAEVEHLDPAAAGDHHVRRLDVAVHEAARVGLGQGLGHLRGQVEDALELKRRRLGQLRQRAARHVLHGDEALRALAAVQLVDLVDHRDVGVVEGRGRPGLAAAGCSQASSSWTSGRSILSATRRRRRRSSAR